MTQVPSWKVGREQPVAGLSIETDLIGSFRYGRVRHIASGDLVFGATSIDGMAAFAATVAKYLSPMTWTGAETPMTSKDGEQRQATRRALRALIEEAEVQ